jgi:RNA polymerase sigma-70 factor (ECF subfamily)
MMTAAVPINLNAFLASAERRAYRMALLATRHDADALDIVQDAMLKLAHNYSQHTAEQWPALFQRILQNRIMDWHRRQTRSKRWLSRFQRNNEDNYENEDEDAENAMDQIVDLREQDPPTLLALADDVATVLKTVADLPLRQQQAFLLRAWEGLDVSATASAMECSEGAVKSHYFRAIKSLRAALLQEES